MDYEQKIKELLEKRGDIMARLSLLPYDGTVEIKENKSGKYIYLRKKKGDVITSMYIDKYSESLYDYLKRITYNSKMLNREKKSIETKLRNLGYDFDYFQEK